MHISHHSVSESSDTVIVLTLCSVAELWDSMSVEYTFLIHVEGVGCSRCRQWTAQLHTAQTLHPRIRIPYRCTSSVFCIGAHPHALLRQASQAELDAAAPAVVA